MTSYGRVIIVLCRPAAILMPWGKYGIMHHVKDYAESRKHASFNVTAQPQSGSSGLQGLGGGTLNKHCAKVLLLPCLLQLYRVRDKFSYTEKNVIPSTSRKSLVFLYLHPSLKGNNTL